MKSKTISTMIVAIAIMLIVSACGSSTSTAQATAIPPVIADTSIVADGRLEPIRYAEIAFNTSGVVSEVLVEEGQQVKKGQPLVRLGNSESARAEVAQAREALISAERTFSSSQAEALKALGDAYEAVRKAQYGLDNFDVPIDIVKGTPAQGVEQMYAKVDDARKAYEPYKYLGDKNPSQKEFKRRLDDAWADLNRAIRWTKLEADLQLAQSGLATAQKEFSALTNGAQELSLAQARYETAQANLSAAQAALASVELVAPFDGVVAGINAKVGGSINPGKIAVTVADFSSWVVKTTDLTEINVTRLSKGQAVIVTLDALPDVALNGKIYSIGQTYAEKQGDIVYEVIVALTNGNSNMRWGMTAAVMFEN